MSATKESTSADQQWMYFLQEMLAITEDELQYSSYIELYNSLIEDRAAYLNSTPILNSPGDVRQIAKILKKNPHLSRYDFEKEIRSLPQALKVSPEELEREVKRTVNILVQLMVMIDCETVDRHSVDYKIDNYKPTTWKSYETFIGFVSGSFVEQKPREDKDTKIEEAILAKHMLKGWKLVKRANITFLPTDDLREHLLYDRDGFTVRIFRHTAFLEAILKKYTDMTTALEVPSYSSVDSRCDSVWHGDTQSQPGVPADPDVDKLIEK